MAGGGGFLLARARSGAAALLALAVVTAIAGALVTGIVGAVRAIETATALTSISQASGDGGRVVVNFGTDAADATARVTAIEEALVELGAARALTIAKEGGGRFVLTPDPVWFSGDAVVTLARELPNLRREVNAASDESAQVSGGLRATLMGLQEGMQIRRGPSTVAVGVVALLVVVVVAAASVEPVRTRRGERSLLRSRGMSKTQLLRITLAEAVPVLVAGAVTGVGAGAVIIRLWRGTMLPWPFLVVVVVSLVVVGGITVAITTVRGVDRRSVRADVLAGVTVLLLLAVVAGVGAWQFGRIGTPVVVGRDGQRMIDPLVAAAPALLLALFAVVAVVGSAPVAGMGAAIVARTRHLFPVLPLRLASRRAGRHTLTTGTTAFAAATLTLAVAYGGSVSALGGLPEELRVGADVRVTAMPDGADPTMIADLNTVDAAMAARTLAVRAAEGTFPLLGVQAAALGDVMLDAGGRIDPDALAATIALPTLGTPLPAGARALTVTVRVPEPDVREDEQGTLRESPPPGVDITVTLSDDEGSILRRHVSNHDVERAGGDEDAIAPRSGTVTERTETVSLPRAGTWFLLAVDAAQSLDRPAATEVDVDVELRAEGVPLDLRGFRGVNGTVASTENGVRLTTRAPDWRRQTVDPTRALTGTSPSRFPVVLSDDLATSLGAEVGSELSLRMASFPFTLDATVEDLVPVIPGLDDGSGVLVDFMAVAALSIDPLSANEVWMSADDPSAAAEQADAAVPGVRVDTADPHAAATARETAAVFLLAAAGAVALTVVVLVLRRSRSDESARELGVLAVLGLGRAGAARIRGAEEIFAIVLGVLGGVVAGVLTASLTVPPLARAAFPGMPASYPVVLTVPPVVFVVAVTVATAVFVGIATSVRAPSSLAPILREAE